MLPLLLISSLLFTTAQSNNPCTDQNNAYYEAEHVCLKWHKTTAVQADAKVACDDLDGTLVNIFDQKKEDFVKEQLEEFSHIHPVWINVEKIDSTFSVAAGSGSLGSYDPWHTAPDVDDSGNKCVARLSSSQWFIAGCGSNYAYFCEIPAPLDCGPGWYRNKAMDTCYKAVKKHKKTFAKAIEYCEKKGGTLATKMTSPTQRREAMSLMKFQGHFWIGVASPNKDGQFEDLDGNAVDSKHFFKKTALKTNGHCVSIRKRRFYSKKCSKRQYFICQKNPVLP